jgi:Cd2+/Zn2+-exporting ATPase
MMKLFGINAEADENEETVVYVAENNEYVGKIYVRDKIKAESYIAISQLKKLGANAVLLSGDKEKTVEKVAQSVGISCYKGTLLPKDKVEEVEKLIKSKKKKSQVCFVGDGINDAPVLMRADVGVSMGGIGSDAAIEASDIVLMKDDLSTLPLAKRIAIKTVRIVKQNLIFALGIKAAILILSAFGITNMWIAVFGDVGVAILCILNAMRVGKAK